MQNKLNILHERETKQKVAQEEEMRDLQMRLENESTYKRFFAKKNKVRAMLPSVAKDIVNKRKSDLEKLSENHETYGDVMILCEDDSSRKPVKHLDLVNVIKTREERNMSLFNFVTRQYDEVSKFASYSFCLPMNAVVVFICLLLEIENSLCIWENLAFKGVEVHSNFEIF